jgi:hypothetical protein
LSLEKKSEADKVSLFFIAENTEKPRTVRKTKSFFLDFINKHRGFLGVLGFSAFSAVKQTGMHLLK